MSLRPVSDLIGRLNELGVKHVALQFPAGLKRRAREISSALSAAGFEVLISGDPCYGACDPALDTLEYAEILVNFGHAPIGDRPDVIFEPVYTDIDVEALGGALPVLTRDRIGLVTTVQHAHQIEEMAEFLRSRGIEAVVAPGGARAPLPGQVLGCSFEAARQTGADEVLFVGTGIFHPTGIRIATDARVVALDPFTRSVRVIDASRMMRRRFAMIEKARGAAEIGIIVSSKTGQQRMDLARSLLSLCDRAVIVLMREVTPDEILNLGFGAYVNTACPRIAYDDQIRFPVPVLSPQEFEILCGVRSWDDYAVDEL